MPITLQRVRQTVDRACLYSKVQGRSTIVVSADPKSERQEPIQLRLRVRPRLVVARCVLPGFGIENGRSENQSYCQLWNKEHRDCVEINPLAYVDAKGDICLISTFEPSEPNVDRKLLDFLANSIAHMYRFYTIFDRYIERWSRFRARAWNLPHLRKRKYWQAAYPLKKVPNAAKKLQLGCGKQARFTFVDGKTVLVRQRS